MKRALKTLLFLFISMKMFGTAQIPDLIIYKGDTLSLNNLPLNSFPNKELINPQKLFGSSGCFYTACWRNYVATWEIINGELYLKKIRNACYPTSMSGVSVSYKSGIKKDSLGNEYADLKKIFPQRFKNGKVKADWVNGKLISPKGELLFYVHDGFDSIYEKEIEFSIKKGVLISTKTLDNSKTKKSKYAKDSKLLREFISENIKRENLPASDSIKRRVFVQIMSTNDNGKIDSVRVVRGVNELYDNEAVRIVRSIPEWNVTYRHGEKYNRGWIITINFDLSENE